jgi:hypothetical protein
MKKIPTAKIICFSFPFATCSFYFQSNDGLMGSRYRNNCLFGVAVQSIHSGAV